MSLWRGKENYSIPQVACSPFPHHSVQKQTIHFLTCSLSLVSRMLLNGVNTSTGVCGRAEGSAARGAVMLPCPRHTLPWWWLCTKITVSSAGDLRKQNFLNVMLFFKDCLIPTLQDGTKIRSVQRIFNYNCNAYERPFFVPLLNVDIVLNNLEYYFENSARHKAHTLKPCIAQQGKARMFLN